MKKLSCYTIETGDILLKGLRMYIILILMGIPMAINANNVVTHKTLNNKIVEENLTSTNNYGTYLWTTIGAKIYSSTVVGGDFSLDFVASAPLTYDHSIGGGFYNDRTIGRDQDVVESLEGGDFQCGDMVTFLTAIKVKSDATTQTAQTIELDYSYLAASTGQPGVALGKILLVQVNSGDGGLIDNGTTATASLNGGYPGTINGTKFVKPATLTGTVTIDGLDPGDVIIVRMDVLLECQIPSSPTGNLQGAITGGRVMVPGNLSKKDATISVGQQTVPFKNVNLIAQGECMLDDFTSVCEGETKVYTASSSATTTSSFAWTLEGNAVFVDAQGTTISNPGNTTTARVKATSPTGTTGCYKVTVTVTADQHTTVVCCDLVTVNAIPPAPTVSITEPSICGATQYGSVTVTCPLNPSSGDPIYEYSNNGGTNWQTNPVFGSIAAGAGFSITVRRIGTTCTSAATNCTNYSSRTCTTPTPTNCGLTACPTNGTAALQSESSSTLMGIGEVSEREVTAYPVPFTKNATIEFRIPKAERYEINLYDMKGALIKQLKSGKGKAGEMQQIEVDGQKLPEGMYLVRIVTRDGAQTVKLLKKE